VIKTRELCFLTGDNKDKKGARVGTNNFLLTGADLNLPKIA
jgi:hypothetical protein